MLFFLHHFIYQNFMIWTISFRKFCELKHMLYKNFLFIFKILTPNYIVQVHIIINIKFKLFTKRYPFFDQWRRSCVDFFESESKSPIKRPNPFSRSQIVFRWDWPVNKRSICNELDFNKRYTNCTSMWHRVLLFEYIIGKMLLLCWRQSESYISEERKIEIKR